MAKQKKSSAVKTNKATNKKSTKAAVVNNWIRPTQSNKFNLLSRLNMTLAVVYAAQAVAILILGKAVTLPVVSHYLTTDTLASQAAGHKVLALAVRHLFDIDIRYLIVAFLAVSAVIQLLIATVGRKSYEDNLQKHVNPLRWLDFGISTGIMFLLIGLLNGIYDASSLMMIFVLVVLLYFMAYLGESKISKLRDRMQILLAISLAGVAVWFTVAVYLKSALFYGAGLSHYVYWLDGSILVITFCLAINKLQSFRAKGKWADYLFSERLFMFLSFVAKTGLTWLVFAGFLK